MSGSVCVFGLLISNTLCDSMLMFGHVCVHISCVVLVLVPTCECWYVSILSFSV